MRLSLPTFPVPSPTTGATVCGATPTSWTRLTSSCAPTRWPPMPKPTAAWPRPPCQAWWPRRSIPRPTSTRKLRSEMILVLASRKLIWAVPLRNQWLVTTAPWANTSSFRIALSWTT
eukprot:Lithocolla_globosa_v1_NODE_5279_length_1269_cov_16.238880.p3 type:complete len:117 gc:universal NODE_5279_length_1269_cov_16.238880:760-1110(+)